MVSSGLFVVWIHLKEEEEKEEAESLLSLRFDATEKAYVTSHQR